MFDDRRARLQIVASRLESGEEIQFDVLAMWRELGNQDEGGGCEGFLIMTDRRLLFGTYHLGVLVDLPVSGVRNAWVAPLKSKAAHLEVETRDHLVHAFWTGKKPAWRVVGAVHGGT